MIPNSKPSKTPIYTKRNVDTRNPRPGRKKSSIKTLTGETQKVRDNIENERIFLFFGIVFF
jgi:hypothetical protein